MSRTLRPVKVGNCVLDGKKIYIQSMLNIPAEDIEGSVRQAVELEKAGCEIVRAAIPNKDAVALIPAIKEKISIPLVADIHFDYRLAIAAAEAGIDKIRINPGNIGSMDKVKAVVKACQSRNIPIRIGVNGGSLEKDLLEKCDALMQYARFIGLVRKAVSGETEEPLTWAVKEAIRQGILPDYLKRKSTEVINMLTMEYDYAVDVAAQKEESLEEGIRIGREEGREQGLEQGRIETIKLMMGSMNLSVAQVLDALNIQPPERDRYRALLS